MLKTSNNKFTIEKIKNHILDFFDGDVNSFKSQVNSLIDNKSIYTTCQAIRYMVDGGCFLIYDEDIRNFLKEILKNLYNEKKNDIQVWNFYKEKLAIVGSRLMK